MKVFSIVFHDPKGLIFSTDRHNDCWIRLFGEFYGRLTKVSDHSEFIKTGSMMKNVPAYYRCKASNNTEYRKDLDNNIIGID